MAPLSRAITLTVTIVAAAILLPEFFDKTFDRKAIVPATYNSPIIDDFVMRWTDEHGVKHYADTAGNAYDAEQFERLVPFLYYSDLRKWGVMPETVKGVPVDRATIRHETQVFRFEPRDMDEPQIGLWPLFECESKFTRLEYPPDLMRIDDRVEFLVAETNEVDEEKSRRFTEAMARAEFRFPARAVAGNPSTRKPFDDGYFVEDAVGQLFHLRMRRGEPWCVDTGIRPPSGIRYVSIRESARREFHGYLVDGGGRLYLIGCDDYRLVELPLADFDPDTMRLLFLADPLYRTMVYGDEDARHLVLTDRDYTLVREHVLPIDRSRGAAARAIGRAIFPFRIEVESPRSSVVGFRLVPGGATALLGSAGALAVLVLILVIRGAGVRRRWPDLLLVAVTGSCGLVAVLVVGGVRSRRSTL